MSKILKDNSGKIWVNSANQIIKSRDFSQDVIQDGLSFWGSADPAFLTFVDGLVSEAYDIRGTGVKMVQGTVANRLSFINNTIAATGTGGSLKTETSQSYKTLFILADLNSTLASTVTGIGSPTFVLLGRYQNANAGLTYNSGTFYGSFYRNFLKTTISPIPAAPVGFSIFHSLANCNSSGIINVGNQNTALFGTFSIKEWGWYNRVLSEQEVIYNINALNAKYNVFV